MSELHIGTWSDFIDQHGIGPIIDLEQKCWSPLLAASPESLEGRAMVFPDGQRCVYSNLGLLATLSVNRTQWDGKSTTLPSWDEVAGDPTSYEQTYAPTGNTLSMMSMNVGPPGRGLRLPGLLVGSLLDFSEHAGVEHVIGSFRPSEYSLAVLAAINQGMRPPTFEAYCKSTNENGEPVDLWLRSLSKNGMKPIAVDHQAMCIPITKDEFASLVQPNWQQVSAEGQQAWWCGETGLIYAMPDGNYEYRESNLWGAFNAK